MLDKYTTQILHTKNCSCQSIQNESVLTKGLGILCSFKKHMTILFLDLSYIGGGGFGRQDTMRAAAASHMHDSRQISPVSITADIH